MITPESYEYALYVIGRLMEEDPSPESPSGQLLIRVANYIKEYEEKQNELTKVDDNRI